MIVTGGSAPAQAVAGNLYYDLVECCLYVFDGMNWVADIGRARAVAETEQPHVHRVIGPRISMSDAMPHPAEVWLNDNDLRQPRDMMVRRLLFIDCTRLVVDFIDEDTAGMFRLVWGGEAVHQP